ncbi:Uncharacterised protein [Mycobacteroides abscessus]|nr:Uncharacterised protein [Mycobacteroides abscessus]
MRSRTAPRISDGLAPESASSRSPVISSAKARSGLSVRFVRPGISSMRASAAPNEMRSRSASAATAPSARSPRPRLGTLRTRRRLTSSSRLSIARRYATASLTSRRS